MIHFEVERLSGERNLLEIPEGIGLSLMEVLKASGYPILATCGGMALCATCHVEVMEGGEHLSPVNDAELDILDTLPSAKASSRLACQLRVDEKMENAVLRLLGENLE